jgi:hypothetical protein
MTEPEMALDILAHRRQREEDERRSKGDTGNPFEPEMSDEQVEANVNAWEEGVNLLSEGADIQDAIAAAMRMGNPASDEERESTAYDAGGEEIDEAKIAELIESLVTKEE